MIKEMVSAGVYRKIFGKCSLSFDLYRHILAGGDSDPEVLDGAALLRPRIAESSASTSQAVRPAKSNI